MNPYKVLKVDRKASAKEITAAYQRARTQATGKQLDQVFDAYAILGDPRLRAEYDRGHVVGTGGRQQVQRRGPRRTGAPRWVQVVVVLVIAGMLATVLAGLV